MTPLFLLVLSFYSPATTGRCLRLGSIVIVLRLITLGTSVLAIGAVMRLLMTILRPGLMGRMVVPSGGVVVPLGGLSGRLALRVGIVL